MIVPGSFCPGRTERGAPAPRPAGYGVAVDVGTTKLAAYLVDLSSGDTLAKAGAMNPQIGYGEDVVSRIAHANKGEAERLELQTRLVDTVNQTLEEFCAKEGICREQIVDILGLPAAVGAALFFALHPMRVESVAWVSDLKDLLAGFFFMGALLPYVEWLVAKHLRMANIAQRRDLSDPDLIHSFADEVGTADRLDKLYLLTYADISAVYPGAMTPFTVTGPA